MDCDDTEMCPTVGPYRSEIFSGLSGYDEKLLGFAEKTITRALRQVNRQISLTSLQLREIPGCLFAGCPEITHFNCSDNDLHALPPELTRCCDDITVLLFCDNAISSLPPGIGGMHRLQRLRFDHNRVDCLPPALGDLSDLEELGCSNNLIGSIPPELGNCRSLRRLDVSTNRIKTIPAELGMCPNLTLIRCHSNPLMHRPPYRIVAAPCDWRPAGPLFEWLRENPLD